MTHLAHHQRTWSIHSKSFPLFSSFHPYALSLNRSLTRSKSAGMNPQCLQILLYLHRVFRSQRLSSALPSDLTTSCLLEALLHQFIILQTHPFYYLLPLCQQTYKTPPYIKIIVSLSLWLLGPSYHLSTSSSVNSWAPATWLPLFQQTILCHPRGQIRMCKDGWLEERIEEKHKTGRKGGKLLASWGYGEALFPGLGAVTT